MTDLVDTYVDVCEQLVLTREQRRTLWLAVAGEIERVEAKLGDSPTAEEIEAACRELEVPTVRTLGLRVRARARIGRWREPHPQGSDRDLPYEQRLHGLIDSIDDFEGLVRRLIVYTVRKHGARAESHGFSPEDFAQEAIASVLEGRRHFDFEGDKTFLQFLQGTIDSRVSHHLEQVHRIATYDEKKLVARDRTDRVIDDIDAERTLARIPPDLQRIYELQLNNYTVKEKAARLGIAEAKVRNLQRRLDRVLKRRNK